MRRQLAAVLTLVLAAAMLTAVGCASAKFTEWTGHHIDEAIKMFGPATRVLPTVDGGKMYVWEFHRSAPSSSWTSGPGGPTVSTRSNSYVTTKTFWVRADGIIASWNFQD
jgi:hypothetical protein